MRLGKLQDRLLGIHPLKIEILQLSSPCEKEDHTLGGKEEEEEMEEEEGYWLA